MTSLAFVLKLQVRLIIFKLSSVLPRTIIGRPVIALGSAHQPWFSLNFLSSGKGREGYQRSETLGPSSSGEKQILPRIFYYLRTAKKFLDNRSQHSFVYNLRSLSNKFPTTFWSLIFHISVSSRTILRRQKETFSDSNLMILKHINFVICFKIVYRVFVNLEVIIISCLSFVN